MIYRSWRQAALLGRAYMPHGSSGGVTTTTAHSAAAAARNIDNNKVFVMRRRHLHEDSSSSSTRGGNYVSFSVSNSHSVDPRFGMDMTHAPGYQLAAEDEPPLKGDQKVVEFAVRHSRLSAMDICQGAGDGYLWIGNVLYPSGMAPENELNYLRELYHDEEDEDEVMLFNSDDLEDDNDDDDDDNGDNDSGENNSPNEDQNDDTAIKSSASSASCINKTLQYEQLQQQLQLFHQVQQQQREQQQQQVKHQYFAKRRYTGGQAKRIRKEREQNAINRARKVPPPRPIRKPHNDIPPELK